MRLPLRVRLTITFAIATAVLLVALGGFLYDQVGRDLLSSIDAGLRSRAQVIAAGLDQGSFADEPGGLTSPHQSFAQVIDPLGASAVLESTPMVSGAPLVPTSVLSRIHAPVFLDRTVPGIDGSVRLLVVPVHEVATRVDVIAGASLTQRSRALRAFLLRFALGAPVAVVVASAAGWLVAGQALRPVDRIRSEAAAISATEPDRRLPVPERDRDLARLSITLNEMLGRLQESLTRERRARRRREPRASDAACRPQRRARRRPFPSPFA